LRIGITKAEREQYRELLKTLDLGLENRLTARVGLLSGGQRQALTLLMATMNKPKLLLLDEHTAALDPKTALKVLTLSARIVRKPPDHHDDHHTIRDTKLTTTDLRYILLRTYRYGIYYYVRTGTAEGRGKGNERRNVVDRTVPVPVRTSVRNG